MMFVQPLLSSLVSTDLQMCFLYQLFRVILRDLPFIINLRMTVITSFTGSSI